MFTLKLYNTVDGLDDARTVIVETAGVWVTQCEWGVKEVHAFRNEVGVAPSEVYYVGGSPSQSQDAINTGVGGNWFNWAVLENQYGKTTEMIR